jgi:hypothetical protein
MLNQVLHTYCYGLVFVNVHERSGISCGEDGKQANTFIHSCQDNSAHLFSVTNETTVAVMSPQQ